MKVSFSELQNDFWLNLEAETLQEAALLARFALNSRKLDYRATTASEKGVFVTELSFRKTKRNATNRIQPQAWSTKQ